MHHKSGNERKYLTCEMIVFINSSDALKYIISNEQYDHEDISNFKKWIEENKFKVKPNPSDAPVKLPSNAVVVESPEAGQEKKKVKTKKMIKKSPKEKKTPERRKEKLEPTKQSPSLSDEIKSEFAKSFTPQKKQRVNAKKSETVEKKRKRAEIESIGQKEMDLQDLLPPGWKFKRNKNGDDFTFTTSDKKTLVGSDSVIEFMSSSKAFFAQDIENVIQ